MASKLPKPIALSLPKAKNGWYAVENGVEQFWCDDQQVPNKWRTRITLIEGGKRKQVTRRAESKRKARELRDDLLVKSRQVGGKEKIDAERVTFRQLAAAYSKADLNPPTYHPSDDGRKLVKDGRGRNNYREGLRAMRVFESYFGDRLLSSITRAEILAWRDARKNEPTERKNIDRDTGKRKPRSWRDVHQSLHFLRDAFNYAIGMRWLTENPASDKGHKGQDKLIRVGLENVRTRALDEQETTRLFQAVDAINDPFLKAVLSFLLGTGIRIEETERIECHMIKLDHGTYGHIYLPARVTKSKKARDLPVLTAAVRDVIRDRFDAIPDQPNALVFGNIARTCRSSFAKAKATARIKNFIMKDCRATFATNALDVIPVAQVAKYLGHDDPKTTMRYLRQTAETHKDNVAIFELHMMRRQTIQESVAVN
jgi:integrase